MIFIGALFAFAAVYYIINIKFYIEFLENVLPYGDPFTYTSGYFRLLDDAHSKYFVTIARIFYGDFSWYWLTNLYIAFLSPFLVKEPYSLSVINFVMYWIASLAYFQLGRTLGLSRGIAFLIGLIVWVFPINYGFSTYSSIPVLGLDSMFSGALFASSALSLTYALHPEKRINAALAGVFFGLAVWGRGNSLPVVGMISFIPVSYLIFNTWKSHDRNYYINLTVFVALAGLMTLSYYAANWAPLAQYYSHHMTLMTRETWSLDQAKVWIYNVPGFLYWREEGSLATITLTILNHLAVPLALWVGFFKTGFMNPFMQKGLRLLALTGAFIYLTTYIVNIIFFIDSSLTLYNVLLIFRPILCGTALLFVVLGVVAIEKKKITIRRYMIVPILVGMWIYAVFFTIQQTPMEQGKERPSPDEVENFSIGFDDILKGERLSFLWYGYYNSQIINYYRRKNGEKDINLYNRDRGKNYYTLWSGLDYSEEVRLRVQKEIRAQFENASAIIIPEFLDHYVQHQPYTLYKFREEIANYLNDPNSPRFVVLGYIEDQPGVRLMILRKLELAMGEGAPLTLPYGNKPLRISLVQLNSWFPEKFLQTNLDVIPEGQISPNGGEAFLLREKDDYEKRHSLAHTFSSRPDKTFKISFHVKAEGREAFRVELSDMYARSAAILDVNVSTEKGSFESKAFGGGNVINSVIENRGLGWYRVEFEASIDEDLEKMTLMFIIGAEAGRLTYSGNGTEGLLFSDFHIE